MNISKIKSNYVLYILFSYISTKKAIKIIKYNKYLGKKLNYKQLIFVKKIEKYDNYHFIKNYWVQFKNEINDNILKEEYLRDLFYDVLSNNKNFILRLDDENFNLLFNNYYFQENCRIDINIEEDDLPFIELIKNQKLTEKTVNTLKEIFNSFSTNGKMSEINVFKYYELIDDIDFLYYFQILLFKIL